MTCPICNDTKITYTPTGVYPCLKCKEECKKSKGELKTSFFHCMFDGEELKELSLGFLKCPACSSIFLPSVLSGGKQKMEEVYKESFEGE